MYQNVLHVCKIFNEVQKEKIPLWRQMKIGELY